ncbi:MAG: flavodoxin family protein [Candidatus Bathyarchaeia archaeon]
MSKAIVVYSTRYGNTEKAAKAICEGLKEDGLDCDCKSIRDITPSDVERYDVVLFGAPTHANNIPEEMTRFMESLRQVELEGKVGAAFDTRYEDAEVGGLSVLERYMKELGISLLSSGLPALLPAGAYMGPLRKNELAKCREFGKSIAQRARV